MKPNYLRLCDIIVIVYLFQPSPPLLFLNSIKHKIPLLRISWMRWRRPCFDGAYSPPHHRSSIGSLHPADIRTIPLHCSASRPVPVGNVRHGPADRLLWGRTADSYTYAFDPPFQKSRYVFSISAGFYSLATTARRANVYYNRSADTPAQEDALNRQPIL